MNTHTANQKRLSEVIDQHQRLYSHPIIDSKLKTIVKESPHSSLSESNILSILRQSRSVFFDTHIEVASGQHTATYLRFESIAQYPDLISMIVTDMARWISQLSKDHKIEGIIAPASEARLLAEGIATSLTDHIPLRVLLAPFDPTSGKIGTNVPDNAIREEEHFLALNDVTARGNCVSKLGRIVTERGGNLDGMMVFARRDSGQFPLMDELTARFPFYYGISLDMPQWEVSSCFLCQREENLFSWGDMPFLSSANQLRPSEAVSK